jgi:hypothetical protein
VVRRSRWPLPGLSACGPSTSSKIIPCISRDDGGWFSHDASSGMTIRSVGVGKSSRTVCHQSWAGSIFQGCPCTSGAVQWLGYSVGYSRGGSPLILDRLLFRPDISPAGTNRARVMRCRRPLVLAADCCCCCHRCCQPRSGRLCPAALRRSPGDCPHRGGDGPVSWPGSLPGPWFLARVLPEAQCQGWPKAISGGNAKRP